MILNVVVDSMIRHWLIVLAATEAGAGGFGMAVHKMASFFCADDGLLASTHPECLQGALDLLGGVFDRFILQTNVGNTVGMVYQPFCSVGRHLEEAYV